MASAPSAASIFISESWPVSKERNSPVEPAVNTPTIPRSPSSGRKTMLFRPALAVIAALISGDSGALPTTNRSRVSTACRTPDASRSRSRLTDGNQLTSALPALPSNPLPSLPSASTSTRPEKSNPTRSLSVSKTIRAAVSLSRAVARAAESSATAASRCSPAACSRERRRPRSANRSNKRCNASTTPSKSASAATTLRKTAKSDTPASWINRVKSVTATGKLMIRPALVLTARGESPRLR